MHLKKLTAIISLLSMSSVLTSCSNTVSFPQSQNSVISGDSATAIQDVAQYDNTTQEQSTLPDEFLDDEVSVTSVSPSTSDTAASDSISAWQPYIDESIASHKSFVFSPESMNIDLDIIARLVDADTASSIMAFTGAKSYLDMPLGFTLKSASRVWLNSGLNINLPEDFPEDLAYPIDMSAPDATEIKNKYVADTTDSMITSTPTEFDSKIHGRVETSAF